MKNIGVPLLLFPALVLFYWKLTLSGQFELMWSPDQATQIVPWFNAAARQLQSWTFPLWDPHLWGGQPFIGQAQPGVAYFLNWALFLMPLKNGAFSSDVLHWYFVVIHYLAALFAYALCRDLGRSRTASALGALAFSVTSYMAVTGWPQMINGAMWTPLVFLFLIRSVEGRRPLQSAALSGMCLGLSWLSGHHQAPLFLSLAAAGTWLFYAIRNRRVDKAVLSHAAIAFGICALIGAFQILPAREYGMNAVRWVGEGEPIGWNIKVPYSSHIDGSMPPSSLIGVVLPGKALISETFVGFAVLMLAILAISTRWHDHRIRLLLFLAILATLFAFGANAGFQGLAYSIIPIVEKARTPGAAIFLFGFSASILSAYGMDTLHRRLARPFLHKSVKGLAIAGGLLVVATFGLVVTRLGADQGSALAALYALLLAALMAAFLARGLRYRHVILCLGILVLLEATTVMHAMAAKNDHEMTRFVRSIRSNDDAAQFLHKQPPPFRILIAGDDIPGNWAEQHDFDGLTGYLASLSTNLRSVSIHKRNLQLLWGAKYTLATEPNTAADADVFTAKSGRKVFYRSDAFPRAWVVHRVEKRSTRQQIDNEADDNLPSFATRALMTSDPPAVEPCTATEPADYRRPSGDKVEIKAVLACKGMVVVSDTYFPGWKAEIDGQPAEIHEVNGAMRGVVVSAGEHTVAMRYRPGSVGLGVFCALLGFSAVLASRFM